MYCSTKSIEYAIEMAMSQVCAIPTPEYYYWLGVAVAAVASIAFAYFSLYWAHKS